MRLEADERKQLCTPESVEPSSSLVPSSDFVCSLIDLLVPMEVQGRQVLAARGCSEKPSAAGCGPCWW